MYDDYGHVINSRGNGVLPTPAQHLHGNATTLERHWHDTGATVCVTLGGPWQPRTLGPTIGGQMNTMGVYTDKTTQRMGTNMH